MLLGKRPRPPMKRTTSLSEITFDLNGFSDTSPADSSQNTLPWLRPGAVEAGSPNRISGGGASAQCLMGSGVPRTHRRNSGDFAEMAHFLRACSLCNRQLVHGRDIYMYRGDSAFCSLECRQQRMNQDERKDKFCLASKKQVATPAAASQLTNKGEKVAA